MTVTKREIRVIATRYYLMTLLKHYDNCSIYQLEKNIFKEINPNKKFQSSNITGRFNKNLEGTPLKDHALVKLLGKKIEGSAQIFFHLIWEVLSNPEATIEEIYGYMETLSPNIKHHLFITDRNTGKPVRKLIRTKQDIYRISMHGGLDALACMLLIIREMELSNRVEPYIFAKWETWSIANRLLLDETFYSVSHDLYTIIQILFIEKNRKLEGKLKKPITVEFPEAFEAPTFNNGFYRPLDLCVTITWYAQVHNIIKVKETDKRKFLFITLLKYSPPEIEEQLKHLPYDCRSIDDNRIPSPLKNLISDFYQDGRKSLFPENSFLY